MYPEHAFLLLFLGIVIGLFVRAYNHGVAPMLWQVAGLAGWVWGGFFFYGLIPEILPDWEAGLRTRLFLSVLVGLIPFLVFRFFAKAILTRLLEDNTGPLAFLSDGAGGGFLSIIPSIIIIVILIACIRVGGTWADLRRFEMLSVPEVDYPERIYPKRPVLARWRDGIERMPLVLDVFEVFDSVNRVPERNLAGLLITTKKEPLKNHLSADPESAPIMNSETFAALLADPGIVQLNSYRLHFALIKHEKVQAAAYDPEIRKNLRELELHRLVDEFMLSPSRQRLIDSIERREEIGE